MVVKDPTKTGLQRQRCVTMFMAHPTMVQTSQDRTVNMRVTNSTSATRADEMEQDVVDKVEVDLPDERMSNEAVAPKLLSSPQMPTR